MTSLKGQRIAVVGAGAVGCYYGGKLAQSGHDVHFLMRADLAAARANGLKVRSPEGDIFLNPVQAAATPEEIGPCDLVLIALKTTSNSALEKLLPPLMHGHTALLPLQNGLGNEQFLAERFGSERVMGGLCFVCLNRVAPAVIEHYGHGTLSLGEHNRPPGERVEAVAAAFREAGIRATTVADLAGERWRKLVWNIPFNGLAIAAGGVTTDVILRDDALHRLTRDLMLETIHAAALCGHPIPPDYADFQIERTKPMAAYKPSSLLDWWEGREVEVESIWGEPLRRALAAGADVPKLEMLYALLKKLTAAPKPIV